MIKLSHGGRFQGIEPPVAQLLRPQVFERRVFP
jgi:hypothetical protein